MDLAEAIKKSGIDMGGTNERAMRVVILKEQLANINRTLITQFSGVSLFKEAEAKASAEKDHDTAKSMAERQKPIMKDIEANLIMQATLKGLLAELETPPVTEEKGS